MRDQSAVVTGNVDVLNLNSINKNLDGQLLQLAEKLRNNPGIHILNLSNAGIGTMPSSVISLR